MGKIAQEILEQIAAANDIVEVVGGYFPLKRAGSTFKALCPFHQEKSPSFTVNPQRQIFKCFGCGAGGGVFKFVELYEHLSFPEAVKKLAARAGIKIVEEELSADDDRKFRMRKRLLSLHAAAAEFFHQQLLKKPSAQIARDYLKSRGVTIEVAKSWKLGYAPDAWDAMREFAHSENFSDEELLASGLVKTRDEEPDDRQSYYDRFRGRVMFPICNDLGEVIAFSGRVLQSDAQAAKYVNSPETILFVKGNVLFGLHKSKRALIDAGYAIVCEGQLDLITAFEAGIENVIAPQGTAFTEKQATLLNRYVSEVVMCFDSDLAGAKAAERSFTALLTSNVTVRIAKLPEGEDPDTVIRSRGRDAFLAIIENATEFFDFQIENLGAAVDWSSPKSRTDFLEGMASFISLVANIDLRGSIAQKVTSRLGFSESDLHRILGRKLQHRQKPIERITITLHQTIALLSQLSLQSTDARSWILSRPWRDQLRGEPDSDVLLKILAADVRPNDPVSVAAFIAGLTTEEEALVSSLLMHKSPGNPVVIAQDCWIDLQRRAIKRRQEAISGRLRAAALSEGEMLSLQKEVLDLQRQLTDIARPFSTG